MKIPVRIQVVWKDEKIIGLWLNDKRIWTEDLKMGIVIPDHTTEFILPYFEATKFMAIIINGMACSRFEELLGRLAIKMAELKKMQDEQNKNLEDVEDWS